MADVGPGTPPDAAERIPPLVDRHHRAFQPAALLLEGRILLVRVHVPPPPPATLPPPATATDASEVSVRRKAGVFSAYRAEKRFARAENRC